MKKFYLGKVKMDGKHKIVARKDFHFHFNFFAVVTLYYKNGLHQ